MEKGDGRSIAAITIDAPRSIEDVTVNATTGGAVSAASEQTAAEAQQAALDKNPLKG